MSEKQKEAARVYGRAMVYQRLESVMDKLPDRFTTTEAMKKAEIGNTSMNRAYAIAVLWSTFKFPQNGVFWVKKRAA